MPKEDSSEGIKRGRTSESLGVGKESSPVDWLVDFEDRRNKLFESLFRLVQDDLSQFNEFIEAAKINPDRLLERCIGSREDVNWTISGPKKTYEERIREHKEACLRHIAFQDLVIRDLREADASRGNGLPQFKLLPDGRPDKGLPWLVNSLTQGHEHVVSVGLLVNREQVLGARRAGGIAKSSRLVDKDYEGIIRPLVKSLLLHEPHKRHALSKAELEQRYFVRIMELWKDHPFFAFDKKKIEMIIRDVMAQQDIQAVTKKSPFEKRRRPPSIHKPDRLSRVVEPEAVACEQWQMGLASGLKAVLEHRFGELGEKDCGRIEKASPEELKVWLCRACQADSVDDVF